MDLLDSKKALNHAIEMKNTRITLSEQDKAEFVSFFPQIVRDLTESSEYGDMQETNDWLARVLEYNVPHGKMTRGLTTVLAYRYFSNGCTNQQDFKLPLVLGWCVEILQAYYLVADDIMDDSQTRRGRLCWYKVDGLGPSAFNDALMLESAVYVLLKKYTKHKPYYSDLVDILHDVNHKTLYGQSLDTRVGLEKNLETYDMSKYSAIVKYKTSFYSFYLPIRLGMCIAGIQIEMDQVLNTMLDIGHLFQVQDDFLDCFGCPNITGKVGTDIQDAKCSWLFVTVIQKGNGKHKQILYDHYGHNQPERVALVKKII